MPESLVGKLFCSRKYLPLAAFIGLLLLAGNSRAGKSDDIIRQVQKRFQSLKSLSLQFTMYSETMEDSSAQHGTIYLQGQERYRMETSDQTIVCDGETIWYYSPSEKQVILYNAKAEDQPFLVPHELLFDYPRKYSAKAVQEAQLDQYPCHLLMMLPKDETDPIRIMEVWVDRREHFTRRLEFIDVVGHRTRFDFKDFVSGQNLPDSTFHFAPPESTEVIDAR